MRILLLAAGCFAACAHAAYTPVNPNGNGDGAERCLTGLTCGAGAYSGALSIVAAFERELGLAPGSMKRVSDGNDQRWSVLGPSAAVLPVARYAGDSSVPGFFSAGGLSTLTGPLQTRRLPAHKPAHGSRPAQAG